ncbi:MAG: cell division protein FtsA [Patescibacteria group bacterium]
MPKERIVSGIDVGSSKVTSVIASVSPEGKVSVIGVSTVSSQGIKKGVVVDIDTAVETIAESLDGAERMAGCAVSSAFIGVNGKHISSLNSHGVVAVAHQEGEITEMDVDRVVEAAQAVSIPSSREIIHVIPRGFIVDNQDEIRDPVGMSGVRLEVETNIISGGATVMRNLKKCVRQIGVDVADLVFSGVASAEAILTDTEKELGTVLVDIGGGTTSITVFANGSPAYASVLPVGGQNITNDLAVGLRLSLEDAEKIKVRLSEEDAQPIQPEQEEKEESKPIDEVDISDLGLERTTVSRKVVEKIVSARLTEILKMVGKELRSSDLDDKLPAGIVLCGGGANTMGVKKIVDKTLGLPLRIGYPRGVTGLIDELGDPAYATSVGLLLYGSYATQQGEFSSLVSGEGLGGIFRKLLNWIRSFLP